MAVGNVYYLHTLNGQPAWFNPQKGHLECVITISNYKQPTLEKYLHTIRKQQKITQELFADIGIHQTLSYGYIRVKVPK